MTEILEELKKTYDIPPTAISKSSPMKDLSIALPKEKLKEVMQHVVRQTEYTHLITITAIDRGEHIEVCYHLSNGPKVLTIRSYVTDGDPRLPTITDIAPGASLYEREVHDLFGVTFEAHPNLSPLLLPDNWPSEVHPLRKKWTREQIRLKIDTEDR
jgi:NADH:ubiquinone oxidoreductase subunit C